MIKHKKHPRERKTWCGIDYDKMMQVKNYKPRIFLSRLVGTWRKVTCKRCLKLRNRK